MSDIEREVEEHNRNVYGGEMPAHNKETLRKKIAGENRFWERQWVFEELQAKHGEERRRN